MTTPACSPEFPWACPPGIREQMLRAAGADERARTRDSGAWFDEWKRTRTPQPPHLSQPPVSWRDEMVRKIETGFKTLGDLAQEEMKRQNEEINRKVKERLETQRLFDEIMKRRFSGNDVAIPPPGVQQSGWVQQTGRTLNSNELFKKPPTPQLFGELMKNATPDQRKQLTDLYAELVKALQPRTVATRHGTYVVDTAPPEVVLRNIVTELKNKNVSPENFYSELISKLKETINRLNEQRTKEMEENLNRAFESVEKQRRGEAELGGRLDRLKSTQVGGQWGVPRLAESTESPLAIPPWRWASPRPVELLRRRTEVLA